MSMTTLAISPFGHGLAHIAASLSLLPMELPLPAHDALQPQAPNSCKATIDIYGGSQAGKYAA